MKIICMEILLYCFAQVPANASTEPKDNEKKTQMTQTQCSNEFRGQHRKGNRRQHTFQPRYPVSKTVGSSRDAKTTMIRDVDKMDMKKKAKEAVDYNTKDEEELDENTSNSEEEGLDCGYPLLHDIPRLTNGNVNAINAEAIAAEGCWSDPTLCVSSYTDKLDTPKFLPAAKRVRAQLQDVCGFLSALAVASDYKAGQEVLDTKSFADSAEFYQKIFELGRRYKIMNPEKMRDEYGKLMYLLQDAVSPELQELLGFSCLQKIRTVYDVLETGGVLNMLRDSRIQTATMVVAP
ncbi:unnamed protein product [Peronospora belbahrii]|uniref:Non-canonical E2 ubiquitin-conjugating enzyme C-terminal domain-containing protein n=1 Tax=Peronospora belbahrii TaxID=622444 RepID=A0ABN8D381_9STRA|nr:unnamed protein product [Peronospora belbahrii]